MMILIVDDHAVVRHGLKQILNEEFTAVSFGEAAAAPEAMQQLHQANWDVCIMDISIPGRNGLEILRDMRQVRPVLPILVHSMHPEELFGVRALKAGASGYVSKTEPPEILLKAIRKLLSGGRYISEMLAERLAVELQTDNGRPRHELLSDREYNVLQLIVAGKTTTEIADTLHLTLQTISTYRSRILEKMQMRSNAELVRYAMEQGLNANVES